MSATPSITLEQGSSVGYGEQLASTQDEIHLGCGNHFLLGRNGRGKTTLLRSIAGSIPFLSGGVKKDGKVFYLSEDLSFDRELSAKQVIKSLVPASTRAAALEFAERIELAMTKPFAELSTGNKRKLSIIIGEFCASAHPAPIILLDEPYTGLDDFVRSCVRELWDSNADQVCRLIVTHPDQDDFLLNSALTISPGKLEQLPLESTRTWASVRQGLK